MSNSRGFPDILLIVYIVNVCIPKTGHCQFTGRSFDVQRTRLVEQTPEAYWPSQSWSGYSSFPRRNDVPGHHGNINNPSRFRNSRQVAYPQVSYTGQRLGIVGRNLLPAVSRSRQGHLSDQTRYSTFNSRAARDYNQRTYIVPVSTQNERLQYSSPERVNRRSSYRDSNREILPHSNGLALNRRSSSIVRSIPSFHGHPNNYSPTYDTQSARFPQEHAYPSTIENQRSSLSFRNQPPINHHSYSPISAVRDNWNNHRLSRHRPGLQTERNEVFQYRTSVMRTPQYGSSGTSNYAEQQRFAGNPVQSLSLPFEPLSLRYQGFRNSKLAGEQSIMSDRATNMNGRNAGVRTVQSSEQFGTDSISGLTGRIASNINVNMDRRLNTGTSQPVLGPVSGHRAHDRSGTTNLVGRPTVGMGSTVTYQPEMQFRSDADMVRNVPGRSSNFAFRSTVGMGNTETFFPNRQSRTIYDGSTNFDDRYLDGNGFNLNAQPDIRFQRRDEQTGASPNGVSFRHQQRNGNWRNRVQNNVRTRNNAPEASFHKILGISRAGLETAFNSGMTQTEQKQERNTYPISNTVQLVERNRRPRQRTNVRNYVHSRTSESDIDDQQENKANLIEEITKNMDIADRLNLFRNRQIHNNVHTNNLPFRTVTNNDNINREMLEREENNAIDDIEDGFTDGRVTSDSNSYTQNFNLVRRSRYNFIKDDENS